MNKIKLAIFGLGVVGSHVVKLLEKNNNILNGYKFEIVALGAKNKLKKRNFNVKKYKWVSHFSDLEDCAKPDIIIETIGGTGSYINNLYKYCIKKNISLINLKYNDREGHYLLLTKRRCDILKKGLKNNKFLDHGSVGEIVCKTPGQFNMYYGSKELNKESFFKGYFKTGDLGYMDKKNYFFQEPSFIHKMISIVCEANEILRNERTPEMKIDEKIDSNGRKSKVTSGDIKSNTFIIGKLEEINEKLKRERIKKKKRDIH